MYLCIHTFKNIQDGKYMYVIYYYSYVYIYTLIVKPSCTFSLTQASPEGAAVVLVKDIERIHIFPKTWEKSSEFNWRWIYSLIRYVYHVAGWLLGPSVYCIDLLCITSFLSFTEFWEWTSTISSLSRFEVSFWCCFFHASLGKLSKQGPHFPFWEAQIRVLHQPFRKRMGFCTLAGFHASLWCTFFGRLRLDNSQHVTFIFGWGRITLHQHRIIYECI